MLRGFGALLAFWLMGFAVLGVLVRSSEVRGVMGFAVLGVLVVVRVVMLVVLSAWAGGYGCRGCGARVFARCR